MIENKESFISLNEYSSENKPLLVSETMILEKGRDEDEKTFGKIIDRGLSFVPRAMRFKKAKKIMRKSLTKYIKKAKKVIDKFSKSFQIKVNTIDPEYKKLKKEVDVMVLDGKDVEAKAAMEVHLKELEAYKKEQMQILDEGIENIFKAYTTAIDERIDAPGFVLNVELSEKGKGELKAKWQEFGAIAKLKIDEHKTALIKSKGWKRIDEIIAEIKAFIESRKYASEIADADFLIENIREEEHNFRVTVLFRISGARLKAVEKGLLISEDPDKLELDKGATVKKFTGTNRYQLGGFKERIPKVSLDNYIRPYIVVKEIKKPMYGDIVKIRTFLSGKKDNIDAGSETNIDNQ